jgi:hypothetical protein
VKSSNLFFPWLYSPILGLGRLLETFRFISVTRSRTVSRTPWTGDKLVARPLLTAPGDCDDGEVVGMKRFMAGEPKFSEKTCPDANLFTTNPSCQTRARTRAAAVGSQRPAASAMARPHQILHPVYLVYFPHSYVGGKFRHTYRVLFFCKVAHTEYDIAGFVERMDFISS